MKSVALRGALYGCLGLGVVDLAALNLLVLPSMHEEAQAIASSPPLVPVEVVSRQANMASLAPMLVESRAVEPTLLGVIEFEHASRRVGHRAKRLLERVAAVLPEKPELTVVGHADATGADTFNDQLSEERAEAVSRRLLALGIPALRIRVEARGARQPSGTGSDRRVEIYLGEAP